MTPEQREDMAKVIDQRLISGSGFVDRVLIPLLAEAERRGAGKERRRKSIGCGCGWCCASMPPGTKDRGEAHHGCSAARADRIAQDQP